MRQAFRAEPAYRLFVTTFALCGCTFTIWLEVDARSENAKGSFDGEPFSLVVDGFWAVWACSVVITGDGD